MKRTKKILILLAAVGAMCGVVAGFLPAFQDAFTVKPHRTVSLPTETVYYAPLETEETTEAATEALPEPTETVAVVTEPEPVSVENERTHYDAVPNFYETDYPDIRYGTGSFA